MKGRVLASSSGSWMSRSGAAWIIGSIARRVSLGYAFVWVGDTIKDWTGRREPMSASRKPGDPPYDLLAAELGKRASPDMLDQTTRPSLAIQSADVEGKTVLPLDFIVEQKTALAAGHSLVELDREIRRATRFLELYEEADGTALGWEGTRWLAVRPDRGPALEVVQADPGSVDFLMVAVDRVRDILLSDPIQLALTLAFFLEHLPHGSDKDSHGPRTPTELATRIAESAQQHGQKARLKVTKRWFGRWEVEFVSSPPRQPREKVNP
jgi:hypothetical protein